MFLLESALCNCFGNKNWSLLVRLGAVAADVMGQKSLLGGQNSWEFEEHCPKCVQARAGEALEVVFAHQLHLG